MNKTNKIGIGVMLGLLLCLSMIPLTLAEEMPTELDLKPMNIEVEETPVEPVVVAVVSGSNSNKYNLDRRKEVIMTLGAYNHANRWFKYGGERYKIAVSFDNKVTFYNMDKNKVDLPEIDVKVENTKSMFTRRVTLSSSQEEE